jgi:hypothetical protein
MSDERTAVITEPRQGVDRAHQPGQAVLIQIGSARANSTSVPDPVENGKKNHCTYDLHCPPLDSSKTSLSGLPCSVPPFPARPLRLLTLCALSAQQGLIATRGFIEISPQEVCPVATLSIQIPFNSRNETHISKRNNQAGESREDVSSVISVYPYA